MQSGYAANILFILGQTLAKLSYALSVMKLAQQVYRRVIQIFGLVILLWGVSAFFVLLFPCHLPAPWDYIHGTCIDLVCSHIPTLLFLKEMLTFSIAGRFLGLCLCQQHSD